MNADERGWSAPIRHPVGREALPAQSAFAVPFHAKPLARGRWSARKQARLTRRKPGEDRESHGDPRGIGRRALGRTSPGSSHHRGLRPPHPSSTDPILGHTGLAQGSAIRTTLRTARQPSPAVAGALVGISAMGAGRVKNAVANGHRATICRRLSQRQVAMFRSETILANSCSLPLRSDVFTRPRSKSGGSGRAARLPRLRVESGRSVAAATRPISSTASRRPGHRPGAVGHWPPGRELGTDVLPQRHAPSVTWRGARRSRIARHGDTVPISRTRQR